jgi:hypothetical protein
MRMIRATLAVASLALTVAVAPAVAAPTAVNVRIEGRAETLFEGPVLTDGHNVKALGDTKAPAAGRRCNGLNNHAHATAGPTPTAAAADAMSILGEGFDGDWYAEPFEDYFITQWGPDRQSSAAAEYWGLVVDNVFTSVGGCQYQLHEGDEVLWVYDAFGDRPRLLLYPGDYAGGPLRLTAEAQLGVPFEVEVDAWDGYNEGSPPGSPQRSTEVFAGAEVAPVVETAKGFEEIDTASAAAETTGSDGRAAFTFATPGWYRLKATRFVAGKETVIRSNRLDLCVPAIPAGGCGAPPADDQVRVPSPDPGGEGPGGEEPAGEGPKTPPGQAAPTGGSGTAGSAGAGASQSPPASAQVRLRAPRLDRGRLAAGLVGVSWAVLDPGPGIAGWTISSLRTDRAGAHYVTRASGRAGAAATLRLPRGATYRLRLTVIDALGRSSSGVIGQVRVPR